MASLIPAGIGLIGGMLGNKSQEEAADKYAQAAQFNPFSVYGPSGSSVVDGQNVNVTTAPTGYENLWGAMSQQGFQAPLNVSQYGPMAAFMPSAFGAFGGGGDFNLLQNFAGMQGQLGQPIDGSNALRGMPQLGQAFAGAARNSLNNVVDVNSLMQQRKGQLDALALPQEQKFYNSSMDNLFGSGRMGTSGGAQDAGLIAQGLDNAQTQRDIASTDWAYGQAFKENDLNSRMAQAFGGMAQGFDNNLFNRRMGLDQLGIDRAMQRFGAAKDMYQYGRDIGNQDYQRAMSAQEFMRSLRGDAMQTANLSLGMGGAQANANQAAFFPQMQQGMNWGNTMADAFSAFGNSAAQYFQPPPPQAPMGGMPDMGGWGVRSAPMPSPWGF